MAKLCSLTTRVDPVSAEAVEAFAADDEDRLAEVLRLKPWECNPLAAQDPDPPAWWSTDEIQVGSYRKARELRGLLEAAMAEQEGAPG